MQLIPIDDEAARSRHGGSPQPLLRRADDLPAHPTEEAWVPLDAALRTAFGALADGRDGEGREGLLAVGTVLTADDTLREYLALADGKDARLAVGTAGLFAFPGEWTDERRARWVGMVDEAADVAAGWLGVDRFPATFVDLREPAALALTHLRNRAVQRKVTFPPDATREDVVHEMVHSLVAPANLVVAEGLACLIATQPDDLREVERELGRHERPPFDVETFFAPHVAHERSTAPGSESASVLLYPVAASFVRYLIERFGRERFFAFTSSILVPLPDGATGDQSLLFAEAFGTPLRDVVRSWWAALRAGGGGS